MLPLVLMLVAQTLLTQANPHRIPSAEVATASTNTGGVINSTPDGVTKDPYTDAHDPDFEWVADPNGFNETLGHGLMRRAKDLGGTTTPKGGTYPAGYTARGGNVWECANEFWIFDDFPPWDTKCIRYKVQEGVCYKKKWKNGFNTLVPDKELSCDFYANLDCPEKPTYQTEADFSAYRVVEKEEKAFLKGKVIRKMYGVKWPCCETWQDAFAYKWRMQKDWDAPGSFKCYFMKDQKGLVT